MRFVKILIVFINLTVLCSGFWSLLLCRMAVGVGEASFVALAAPFIGEEASQQAHRPLL